MTNIQAFLSSISKSDTSPEAAQHIATVVTGGLSGSTFDWDEDAGEHWGRVMDGAKCLAFVLMTAPLAFVREDAPGSISDALKMDGYKIWSVRDMDARTFCCDRDIVVELARRTVSNEFDNTCFSVEDLVWATI